MADFLPERYAPIPIEALSGFIRAKLVPDIAHHLNGWQRQVAFEIWRDTVQNWPIKTGYSRANWTITVNSVPAGPTPPSKKQWRTRSPKTGRFRKEHKRTIRRPASASERSRAWEQANASRGPVLTNTLHVSNPVDYSRLIEFGGGRGAQAEGRAAARLAISSVTRRLGSSRDTSRYMRNHQQGA